MSDATIPPPSEAEKKIDMVNLHNDIIAVGRGLSMDGSLLVIRRCHAAETALAAANARIAEQQDELKRREDRHNRMVGASNMVTPIHQQLKDAEATVAELREALHRTQWGDTSESGYPQCPVCCGVAEETGHYAGCMVAAALAKTAPEAG